MARPQASSLPSVIVAARNMLEALNTRFRYVTSTSADIFDPIYVTATFLTPAYRGLLTESHVAKAKSFLQENADVDEAFDEENDDDASAGNAKKNEEPPLKRFKHLNCVSAFLRSKEDGESSKTTSLTSVEEEIERNMRMNHTDEDMELDPLVYWIREAAMFPKISHVACDIMCVPASSAPVERVFSISGDASHGRRNRLSDHNLERETLLRKNKQYL